MTELEIKAEMLKLYNRPIDAGQGPSFGFYSYNEMVQFAMHCIDLYKSTNQDNK